METYMRTPKTWAEKLAEMNLHFNQKVDYMVKTNPIESIQTSIWLGNCTRHGIVDHDAHGCTICTAEVEAAYRKREKELGKFDDDDDIPF
jgi:hypothetical protein